MHRPPLLDRFVASAGLAFQSARAAPGQIYADAELLGLEQDGIFKRDWLCVARAAELSETGDYVAFEIAGEPLFLVRDTDGALRAFTNICRHRGAQLLGDRGNTRRIVCPYHAWTYDLQGRCVAAPFMHETPRAALPEFPVEIWEGWVYVSLNPAPTPLATQLGTVSERFAGYRLAEYRPLLREDEIWATNWKLAVENFIDPYHLFRVHAQTVEPALPTRLTKCLPGEAAFTWFLQQRVADVPFEYASELPPANPGLSAEEQRTVPIVCVLPSHLISISADRLFWMSVQPRGAARTAVRWGLDVFPRALPDGGEGERLAAELQASFRRINEEDKVILQGLAHNAGSAFAQPGPLSSYERTVWEFHRFLARRLAPGCEAEFD